MKLSRSGKTTSCRRQRFRTFFCGTIGGRQEGTIGAAKSRIRAFGYQPPRPRPEENLPLGWRSRCDLLAPRTGAVFRFLLFMRGG